MSKSLKFSLIISILLLVGFITTESLFLTNFLEHLIKVGYIGLALIVVFTPFIFVSIFEYIRKTKKIKFYSSYQKQLNEVIISQSYNILLYEGNTNEGAKALTKEVTETINVDRCSIWLYNEDRTSIKCQQLYVKSENKWYQDIELFKKDYQQYFLSLLINPVIIANDAEKNPATSCFTETYLRPIGIKSMLDVPIIYKGNVIGVICIENLTRREWKEYEVNFAQMLSSLYSFSHSVRETNIVSKNIKNIENFVDYSVLVSKTDKNGKITYVNKKFEEVSGWKLRDVLGKDHNIVNSGYNTKDYWKKMYETVIKKRKIWNDVIINKTKLGELYWVDSYIMAEFGSDNELKGFMSIRYDVTELVKKQKEIENKNTYLEHAAKILRHDMHSGINTYIPRGISSLERRLTDDVVKNLKLESPLKMLKEGLKHTQKVYMGVYEFTNLVKKDVILNKTECDLKEILESYLTTTSYKSQVKIDELLTINVNEPLFCTAIDNLIRNGLKYNDSDSKFVHIYLEDDDLVIQDNGRGLTKEEFEIFSKPYTRKQDQKESGTGLGLNICLAILNEHSFSVSCDKNKIGTKIKIKIKNDD